MKFSRIWAMPSRHTFTIKPIADLLARTVRDECISVDPFCGFHSVAKVRNDLNPEIEADSHLDVCAFAATFADTSIDCLLFDPPYSPRQISECYKGIGLEVSTETTQSSFWSNAKKSFAPKIKHGGSVICFGWNSGGFGKTLGFELIEVLLVPHGGAHNDTICTVEVKS